MLFSPFPLCFLYNPLPLVYILTHCIPQILTTPHPTHNTSTQLPLYIIKMSTCNTITVTPARSVEDS